MLRLKANKTALYKLVADYVDNLPPMRSGTEFIKYPRTPDYALNWITPEWNTAHAFFSTCMGRPLLSIEIRDGETGKTASRTTYSLTLRDLRERGMVEEFVTAAEFHKALLWAEAANRPLAARYHRTKKKRIRKKYAKRILAWYREEIL